ncbi:MAG: bifunctional oligoribonuclease/PAP phosphatase NrnA [Candidatus Gastranaerophilaceae bacterium]
MNISAINGVKATNFSKNTSYVETNKVKADNVSQYQYSALDKMGSLGKSLVQQSQKRLAVSFTGWSPEAHNKETIDKMVKIMKDPSVKRIAVSGHTSPDGDSFGTSFAMANLINQATGKKVDLFVFGNSFPERYKFLDTNPDVNVIVHKPGKYEGSEKAAQKYGKYDLAIACDCAESKLMAADYKGGVLDKAKYSFKIDHHPYKEEYSEKYGKTLNNKYAKTENLIDTSLPAAAEIAMQFVEPLGLKPEELRKEAKDAMFTGMLTDTGCFKFANTPMTFEDAALLMRAGVNNREVNLNAMGNTPQVVLDTEKLALSKIQYAGNGKIAYIIEDDEIKAAKKACKDAGYEQEGKDAIKGTCGRLPEINGVEVGFKVYEGFGAASISIRSRNLDVSEIAREYGGGGHKNAAAFQIKKGDRTLEETVNELIEKLNAKLEQNK